jgi:hypothetical protein
MFIFALTNFADMVKLVDMPDLGSGAARRVGSSPIIRTKKASQFEKLFCFATLAKLQNPERVKGLNFNYQIINFIRVLLLIVIVNKILLITK